MDSIFGNISDMAYGQRMKLKYPIGTTIYITSCMHNGRTISNALATITFVSTLGEITCELAIGLIVSFMPSEAMFNKVVDMSVYTDECMINGSRVDAFA